MIPRSSIARLIRMRHSRHRRLTPPGSPPGTIIIDPQMPEPKLHLMAYTSTEFKEQPIEKASDACAYLDKFPFIWLQVEGLGNAEVITEIKDVFKLHRLAMEDVVNVHQRAKVEEYDEHLYIVLRLPIRINGILRLEQLSLFIGKNYVITFEENDHDALEPVKDRIRRKLGLIRNLGADYLAYAVIDAVIDRYFPMLEQYGDMIEDVEIELLNEKGPGAVKKIYMIKQDLLALRRAIWPARDAINSMIRDQHPLISDGARVYLRDCYDHVIQIIDILETDRELSSDLLDLHMTMLSNRTNDIMKILTMMSTIFIPLSFIASVYGMNFNTDASHYNMPELNNPFGYPMVLLLMGFIGVVLVVFFWKKGWLGKRQTPSGTTANIHHGKKDGEHNHEAN
ncbi:magnesium/cobalt transporter CorA [Candidatus Sumerlaeota bacterium]|nr:magnesium/cobalt transporter CorA [Candidatus Sumerlaeota bacterium]